MKSRIVGCLLVLTILAIGLAGCGGGGSSGSALGTGGGGGGPASVTGTVTGTTVIAVNEGGTTAASSVATGNPPRFTLSLPAGHSYKFFFITGEGTSAQRTYLLYDGATTRFSFQSGKAYDFGLVTTNPATGKATPGTGLVSQSGVTAVGTDNTAPSFVLTAPENLVAWYFDSASNDAAIVASTVSTADTYRLYSSTDNTSYSLTGAAPRMVGNAVAFDTITVPRDTYFRIVPVKGGVEGIRSAAVFLNFSGKNGLPAMTLTSPVEGETGVGAAPTFQWQAYPGAAAYVLLSESGTQNLLVKLSGTNWSLGSSTNVIANYGGFTTLSPNAQYDFIVWAVDANGTMIAKPPQSVHFTTGAQTPGFTQADLTGTWDIMQFKAGTQAPFGGWFRVVGRFDGQGHLFVDDNTTFQSTVADDYVPNGDSGMIMTVNSAGTITETGDTTFHGNMASNKQLIVATTTLSPTERAIWILRKRVPAVTYTNADLFNKSFAFHILSAGGRPEWERGDGSINTTGSVTLANMFDSSGAHLTNMVDIARFSISTEGVVTDALDPDFKGFLTPDKKVLIGTGTNPLGPAGTNYDLMILTISGGSFVQADLAGTWNFHNFGAGASSEWSYDTLTIDASGTGTHSGYNSSAGFPTPPSSSFNMTANGEITTPASSSWHGTISSGKDLICATATTGTGEYKIYLGVK